MTRQIFTHVMKIKLRKKVKSVIRKEGIIKLTPRQLIQLHSIASQIPKKGRLQTADTPNLK